MSAIREQKKSSNDFDGNFWYHRQHFPHRKWCGSSSIVVKQPQAVVMCSEILPLGIDAKHIKACAAQFFYAFDKLKRTSVQHINQLLDRIELFFFLQNGIFFCLNLCSCIYFVPVLEFNLYYCLVCVCVCDSCA